MRDGDWVDIMSRTGDTVMRANLTEKIQPGVVYTTFHFPESAANIVTTDNTDWATSCPEYKVTAVQVVRVSQRDSCQQRAAGEREQHTAERRRKKDAAPA